MNTNERPQKGLQIWKENAKLSLFMDGMIFTFTENCKIQQELLVNKFRKETK